MGPILALLIAGGLLASPPAIATGLDALIALLA
ncbi:unnamed protein product [Bacillus thuringiensis DB27]|uniref:Uncharacterized protein n=1 Tax=Bacillus thuringiensis DB27 TaxID=1431339 RepID=W8YMN4_BACTU|nr:unnamed protein product [Bacillus thuringiensis DB27]